MSNHTCLLCPRACRADRAAGDTGFCRAPSAAVVAARLLHFWEEPCISGKNGSGTVFFSGCNLRCSYCQNIEISRKVKGESFDAQGLAGVYRELISHGAENINLVTPTIYADVIAESLTEKPPVPVIYNCGGYESAYALELMRGKADIYLPDLKYSDDTAAARLSSAPDYFVKAKDAILEMHRQVGSPVFGENGQLLRGVMIRHLVLPGYLENTFGVLDWIAESFAPGEVLLSLMSQFTPNKAGEPSRKLTAEEYSRAVDYAKALADFEGYFQDPTAAEDGYVPEF
ncbi:MAG: 4Fe-4S cluster-binding domain-containing protein [Oscillospiraceae bacterium]|jgi:putative pyruvate formate lyase activating enzyme|nr:4Fe-4S cluster-binding domain-containing protein [Oscillospiraceae bacterium]